ncbi:glyoxalase/bleomycin resistance protein/dioxygenase superfamily protein [Hoeflea marina]|uniref:Glyoxalase/bleomycin resistance protein/dioxygenase superfamily protein n=1 Tax=Hoeflea marina TaxID=274592 RepID=A0A317PUR9_9HYPH|nr:VOC family protein [Hoeflea marina]PWW04434.1 glyoxalase/bleomycin resistance protein/dioxygenase superfamily protein [Hoeflea marina]
MTDNTQSPAPARGFAVLGLGEIAIRCNDLASMTAFYRDIIGLDIFSDRGGIVFFRLDNGVAGHTAVLALFDRERNPDRPGPLTPSSTLHHLALTVAADRQGAACSWFDRNGITWHAEDFGWVGWRGIFVRDPEGNTVELVARVTAPD